MDVFERTELAGLILPNRIIRSATHEGLADLRGFPKEGLKEVYTRLAKGGVGAIITGYAGVCAEGRTFPNMLMMDSDESIPAFRDIAAAVKPYGVPLLAQLAHGGGMTDPAVTGAPAKAPSRYRYRAGSGVADELSQQEIRRIVDCFVRAIIRARQSGFDGVELHAAHGYLLSEFLSPRLNRRQDDWGGTTAKRFRILREIIIRARDVVGKYPILVKFSAYDSEKGGMRLDEAVRLAQLLQEASVDAIEVSCGNGNWFSTVRSPRVPVEAILALEPSLSKASWLKKQAAKLIIPYLFKSSAGIKNYNVTAAETIKANIDIPVIVVGGIRNLAAIRKIISQGKADFVSMCRPFVIEPELVNKMRSGQQEESRCINCGYCLIGVSGAPLRCYYGRCIGC